MHTFHVLPFKFHELIINGYSVCSATVCKGTWDKRAIKSKNHAWTIHAKVEENALRRMGNGSADAMHGGKVHDANDA